MEQVEQQVEDGGRHRHAGVMATGRLPSFKRRVSLCVLTLIKLLPSYALVELCLRCHSSYKTGM